MSSSSSGKGRRKILEKEEDSNNVEAIPESSREIVKNMKDVVNCSEQEVYAMLVECNFDADEAITRLLSQDSFQEVKSKRDKKKETKDTSGSLRVGSSNQNCELRNGGDDYVGGNKFNSDETSDVQGFPNRFAGSFITSGILGPGPPLNSVVSNVETKRVPISSGEAVPSLSVPPSRLISALGCGTSSQTTMTDVVKMGSASSKESVTEVPEKPVVPNPFSNSFIDSASRRDQLGESPSVSNQNFRDGDDGGSHLLCDNYNNKNDETCQVQKCSFEHNQTKDPSAVVNCDQCNELQHLRFGSFGSGKPSGLPSRLLCDNSNNKDDETCQVQSRDPSAPVDSDQCINQLQHLRFGSFSGINGSGKLSGLPSKFLNDDSEDISDFADDVSLRNLNLRDGFEQGDSKRDKKKENVTNGETKTVPISSGEAVASLSVPSSWGFDNYCQRTVPDVVKMGLASSKENVTNALEKPDKPNPFSNSFPAKRDQLQESSFISNQNFRHDIDDYGGSQLLRDKCNNKNDETYQEQRRSFEHNQTNGPSAPGHTNLLQSAAFVKELLQLRYGGFGSGMNGSAQPSGLPSQFLNDDSEEISGFADDLSLRHLNLKDGECHEEKEQQLRTNVANSQLFTPVIAPSERSLQMPHVNTFPNAMHQQAYTRELNPLYSASPLIQSTPTASSLGPRLSVSKEEMNRQTINHNLYSHPYVPSRHYGHMMNYPCSLPTQNDTYDMPTSAFQQHGGGNNNAYHQHSLATPLTLYRNTDLRQPAVPSTRSSAYGSTNGSAYGFGMLSDNRANSRFEFEDDFRPQLGNHLSLLQHQFDLQNGNSNMWIPQGHNNSERNYCSSLFPGQQSLSFGHNQQQQVEQEESYRFERSRLYNASVDQQNNRRGNPSNQTQQQQWPRNNN